MRAGKRKGMVKMESPKTVVPILKFLNKFPAGTMLIPMLICAAINTWLPGVLDIGGPTTAMFKKGTLCIAGIMLFISGAKLSVRQIKLFAKVGGVYLVLKLIIAFGTGILFALWFGMEGVFGISSIAFISCMYSCNPGVYAGIASDYGDDVDRSLMALIMVLCMQAVGVVVIEITSGAGFDVMAVVNVIAPFILGFILGNLDPAFAKLMAPGTNVLLPFIGCCFGSAINLVTAFRSGLAGILLTILYLVINIPIMWGLGDKVILKRPGWCGMAFCAVAGISISLPALVAGNHPEWECYVNVATAQIAMVVLLTSYITPFLCRLCVRRSGATPGSAYDMRQKELAEKTTADT